MKKYVSYIIVISFIFLLACGGSRISEPLKITIGDNEKVTIEYKESNVNSVLKMILWKKDGKRLLWAISGLSVPYSIEYGNIPAPGRSELGYIESPAKQLYPVEGISPPTFPWEKDVYILFEVDEDSVFGPNLDIILFEANWNHAENEYNIKKIKPFRVGTKVKGSIFLGRQYGCNFDDIGNRKQTTRDTGSACEF